MPNVDPLGILRNIEAAQARHDETPVNEVDFAEWLDHPITKRFHEALQLGILRSRLDFADDERARVMADCSELILSWNPTQGGEDEQA